MLHVFLVCCPRRDMHERNKKWKAMHLRCRPWAEESVWDAPLEAFVELRLTDDWQHQFKSSSPSLGYRMKPILL